MALTDQQFDHILRAEGRYANLVGDTGGETYGGVSRNNHPDWSGWGLIDQAKQAGDDLNGDDLFYRALPHLRAFYDEYAAGVLADQIVAPTATMPILDSGVTGGRNAAAWVIQSICQHEGHDPNGVDGKWGPGARAAVAQLNEQLVADNGQLIGDKMPLRIAVEQFRRYLAVADAKARNAVTDAERAAYFGHLRSWLRRTFELLDAQK